jgi:uncharacterized protein YacL
MTKSYAFYCLRYAGLSALIMVMVAALTWAMYAFAPELAARIFDGGGSSGAGVVSVILPTLLVAQVFYRHERRPMAALEGWLPAIAFTVLAFVVSGVLAALSLVILPLSPMEQAELSGLWNDEKSILLNVGAVLVVINNVMLWSGIRGGIKKADRLAARG